MKNLCNTLRDKNSAKTRLALNDTARFKNIALKGALISLEKIKRIIQRVNTSYFSLWNMLNLNCSLLKVNAYLISYACDIWEVDINDFVYICELIFLSIYFEETSDP